MGKNYPPKEVKTSDVINFIKHHALYHFGVPQLIIHDNGPNSLDRHFTDSAINSEFKVCLQRHTIQLPLALQKPSTRPSANFSRSSFQKVNATGIRNWVTIS